MTFFSGLWTITAIELRQRVRGVAWYVLLGVFVVLTLIVSAVLSVALSYSGDAGAPLYSTIVFFVLLLASLVTPALGGNTINGDRESGTLATTQVTLVTTTQLVLGKFLAAWISSLAFLAVSVPFMLYSFALGGTAPATVIVSILVLAAELAVIAAIGVGLSGVLRRPLFSIVVTYLVVAMLSVGTLIGFTLGGLALETRVEVHQININYDDPNLTYDDQGQPVNPTCIDGGTYTSTVPRFDLVWWMLAANPYVVLADAAPTQYDESGEQPVDLFGSIKTGVRYAQVTPDIDGEQNDCADIQNGVYNRTPREVIESTTPGWLVGLLINLALAVAALWGAIALTHAPSKRLAAGSRIA